METCALPTGPTRFQDFILTNLRTPDRPDQFSGFHPEKSLDSRPAQPAVRFSFGKICCLPTGPTRFQDIILKTPWPPDRPEPFSGCHCESASASRATRCFRRMFKKCLCVWCACGCVCVHVHVCCVRACLCGSVRVSVRACNHQVRI